MQQNLLEPTDNKCNRTSERTRKVALNHVTLFSCFLWCIFHSSLSLSPEWMECSFHKHMADPIPGVLCCLCFILKFLEERMIEPSGGRPQSRIRPPRMTSPSQMSHLWGQVLSSVVPAESPEPRTVPGPSWDVCSLPLYTRSLGDLIQPGDFKHHLYPADTQVSLLGWNLPLNSTWYLHLDGKTSKL